MAEDNRSEVYHDLHGRQLAAQELQNHESARRLFNILFEYVQPSSLLDVGCGLGTWLRVAQDLGIRDVRGLEGNWLDPAKLVVDPALVTISDLEQGFALQRKFDLVVCLEVAEHLSKAVAETFVACLAAHGDVVLFSAAIPFQGGHHHVNEQFQDYWAGLFARHGLRPLDVVRPQIWTDATVLWWLRQNTLLFAHDRVLAANEKLRHEQAIARPLALVHPAVYMTQLRRAHQRLALHAQTIKQLSEGGTFSVTKRPDGQLGITKL